MLRDPGKGLPSPSEDFQDVLTVFAALLLIRIEDLGGDQAVAELASRPRGRAKWLWRSLRAAELAGLDARQVLADAVGARNLAGARDIAAVIDARIRRRVGAPGPAPAWSAQVPAVADPERGAYARQIAALMDARKERIGEHTVASGLPWAVSALGPVPADPVPRLQWQQRASAIGAYRELSGYHHPADPIGPEPAPGTSDLRAAWHEALTALGPAEDTGVRGVPDGLLLHLRDTYPTETAWAPPWAGDELRQARAAARDARLAALRAAAEAAAARRHGNREQAARQQALAVSYQALHDAYRERETMLATVMADRAYWEQATRRQRQLAVAADGELRRRHPGQPWPPLRSAEPSPAIQAQPSDQALISAAGIEELARQAADLAARHREFADRLAERQNLMISAEDPTFEALSPAFPPRAEPGRDAILQPPKPQIRSSEQVLDHPRRPRPPPGSRRLTTAAIRDK
jgi:hypothetical protein